MKHVCDFEGKGFEKILQLPRDHADRLAVENCARCGARLAAYREFLEAKEVPEANLADAEARLAAFIEAHAGAALGGTREGLADRIASSIKRLFSTKMVLVPAALVLLLLGVLVIQRQPWIPAGPVLRDANGPIEEPVLLTPRFDVGGVVRLEWEPQPGADTYEVRILGPDLLELMRLGPISETGLLLEAADVPDTPTRIFWQVVAFEAGDEIGASTIGVIEVPEDSR